MIIQVPLIEQVVVHPCSKTTERGETKWRKEKKEENSRESERERPESACVQLLPRTWVYLGTQGTLLLLRPARSNRPKSRPKHTHARTHGLVQLEEATKFWRKKKLVFFPDL